MSAKSNNQGRAYEYIFIKSLFEEINKTRPAEIIENTAYNAALRVWLLMPEGFQFILKQSAVAAVSTIFDMEPMILENGTDILQLKIQADKKGKEGDVRDIVISRSNMQWEIGLSIKHNHKAAKHSRLSKQLDFGKEWYNIPCSEMYWNKIKPIFAYLENENRNEKYWKDIPNKKIQIYSPLLKAFLDEILYAYTVDTTIVYKMVEYILGEFDFYKVISIDKKHLTQIQTYNLHGTLNQKSSTTVPKIRIPRVLLPTRIVSFGFKPNSDTTLELYMDRGWQFSFRLHNAEKKVIPSLKFDVQIIGMPTTIISIDCRWH